MTSNLQITSFDNLMYQYPITEHNDYFNNLEYKDNYIENSWLLIPTKMLELISNFVMLKQKHGYQVEKQFYQNMNVSTMIYRLLKNRPLSFVGGSDSWVLRDKTDGFGGWETIGTDQETQPLVLKDYLSYDEIELSSFLSLSIFTPFINKGSRENIGKPDPDCQPNGIYIGQNGARFERHARMEWRYMVVDSEQNTVENGYGLYCECGSPMCSNPYCYKKLDEQTLINKEFLGIWEKFYAIDHFPLYTEAEKDTTGRFYKLNSGSYLDLLVYKKRIKIVAEVFLREANHRAKKINKKAFCHVVGLGLGAWKISSARDVQTTVTIKAYLELLQEHKFEHISDLYFAWFNIPRGELYNLWFAGETLELNGVKILSGHRNPADPLDDPDKLLIANWAWDPNSYVGNEYWCGELKTSGDPAAGCCSFIPYIGNPDLCKISEIHHFNTG